MRKINYPSTPIGYASFPRKAVVNLSKPFYATIQFYTGNGYRGTWAIDKKFNDEGHMENFISLIERNRGWSLDELWLVKNV